MSAKRLLLPHLLATAFLVACGSSPPETPPPNDGEDEPPRGPIVDLRADVNRDGVVDVEGDSDEEGEDDWTAERGAIFLANIDDDESRCKSTDDFGRPLSDAVLPFCNDAADNEVNGEADLLDMAELRVMPWPDAPDDMWVQIQVSHWGRVRLFRKDGEGNWVMVRPNDPFGADEIRGGMELRLEGRDIVRDLDAWDGYVTITLRAGGLLEDGTEFDEQDEVRLRISPVMTFHHLERAETVTVSRIPRDPDSIQFVEGLKENLAGADHAPPLEVRTEDPWNQDYFETGYMSMPGPGGRQHVIRVAYRSANLWDPRPNAPYPLRPAGRVVFEKFRGPDTAGIQHYDPNSWLDFDTLDSMGNTETIPPYTHEGVSYPLGRLLRGSAPDYYPDLLFSKMLEAQGQQPPVYVDTSWLLVAHVDETISFIKANTPRGWLALVNDARLAKTMLEEAQKAGHGSARMFRGKKWMDDDGNEYPAEVSIDEVLADTEVLAASNRAAIEVDAQVEILKKETGLTDEEIISVPFLHWEFDRYSVSYQPGTVNMLVLDDRHLVVADPHGPEIDGKDIFKDQLEKSLGELGYKIWWQEDWDLYHRMLGEVHCATNATRTIPEFKWWESGR